MVATEKSWGGIRTVFDGRLMCERNGLMKEGCC